MRDLSPIMKLWTEPQLDDEASAIRRFVSSDSVEATAVSFKWIGGHIGAGAAPVGDVAPIAQSVEREVIGTLIFDGTQRVRETHVVGDELGAVALRS